MTYNLSWNQQKRKGRKKKKTNATKKIALALALTQLVQAVVDLVKDLLDK